VRWRKITLIGVGLLGGSLGLAIRKRGLAGHVEGYVRRSATVDECLKLGVLDHAGGDLHAAVANADLIIFCTPLGRMRELAEQMLPFLKRGAIVTDVGSVKGSVVAELETLIHKSGAHFVGSHPMAGGEKTGVAAARADMFQNAICVLTPTTRSSKTAVRKLEQFWQSAGANVLKLSPKTHDDLVGRSSHLPHIVAAKLANYVLNPAHPKEQSLLCASGFRDTTRVASGSPEMWRDIAMANRRNLDRILGVFIGDLQKFQRALKKADVRAIETFFQQAKERRDKWHGRGNSPE
jgi:prephenate dehydrogenase